MSELKLDKDSRTRLAGQIRRYLDDELEIEIGNMDAEALIDYLSTRLGASFYNLGLKDGQALVSRRMDDLVEDFYGLEKPEDPIR